MKCCLWGMVLYRFPSCIKWDKCKTRNAFSRGAMERDFWTRFLDGRILKWPFPRDFQSSMKIMKKSSNQFLERKILYNIVQSIPIICNQHLSALTCTYIHDTANIGKLLQTCFHPIFASECFRAFSGQSFCTVLFPYQAVVSRTWFPYQFLCVANCLENALVPILVSYFFKHKTTTDFL